MSLVLPDWASEIRPHQEQAVDEIIDAYQRGAQVVVLDAPTGSGKTLIADMVRQVLGVDTTNYVCSDKSLQAQFLRDFEQSRVLMGKANYRPNKIDHVAELALTCDDCTGRACNYCTTRLECPYIVARGEAFDAPIAVLNTAYYLREANGPGRFAHRQFHVFDECDTLEGYLMGWAEVRIGSSLLRKMRLTAPTKRSHWTTLLAWLKGEFFPVLDDEIALVDRQADPKEYARLNYLKQAVRAAVRSYEDGEPWVKEVDHNVVLRPVLVSGFGERGIWRHIQEPQKALLMSGSVISPRVMLEEIGFKGAWETVVVPMTFPSENRPIYHLPVAPVIRKSSDADIERVISAVRGVVKRHPHESVLVHTVSYDLTRKVVQGLERLRPKRSIYTYNRAVDRQRAIDSFAAHPGSVMVAPSMDRGVDLADDLCRVQVIAKVPSPNLGDRMISERLNHEGGENWYAVQTVRTVVQMTGRAVRSEADHAVTYVLDSMFTRLLNKNGYMFPEWWVAAVSTPFQPADLIN